MSERSFSEKIDKRIKLHILDAPLIIKNFVNGDNKCNYELYLVEMLNGATCAESIHPHTYRGVRVFFVIVLRIILCLGSPELVVFVTLLGYK